MEEEGAKSVAIALYGPELATAMAKAAGHKGKLNWRKILEPVDAVTQCNRTIDPFKNDIICYICGIPIPTKDKKTSDHELYPECEHILPVTQARWFLELYTGDATKNVDYKWLETAFKSEYAYAHRVCNQAKGMDSFFSELLQKISADKTRIKEILTKIKNRANNDLSSGKYIEIDDVKTLTSIRDMNIEKQSSPGSTLMTRLAKIETIANNFKPADVNLLVLARTTIITDPNVMVGKIKKIMVDKGPEFIRLEKIRKELTLDFINRLYEEVPKLSPSNIGNTLFGSKQFRDELKKHKGLTELFGDFLKKEFQDHVLGIFENWKIIQEDTTINDETKKSGAALQVVLFKILLAIYNTFKESFPAFACNIYHDKLTSTLKGIEGIKPKLPPNYSLKLPVPAPDKKDCDIQKINPEALALKRMTDDEFQKVLNDSEYTPTDETTMRILEDLLTPQVRYGGKHRKTRRKQKRRLTRKRINKSR